MSRLAGWTLAPVLAVFLPALALRALTYSGPTAAEPAAPLSSHLSSRTAQDTVFRHANHVSVPCLSCHSMDPAHGEVKVRTLSDCRACHHAPSRAGDCATCHTPADAPAAELALLRTLELSVGRPPHRLLPFSHEKHVGVSCASCHTEGLSLSAAAVSCGSCHTDHHVPEARCATCHVGVLEPPHGMAVHVGCAGAGCHSTLPFQGVPRTRNLCVACHQDMEDHRPGRECTVCHLLPPPRPPGGDE